MNAVVEAVFSPVQPQPQNRAERRAAIYGPPPAYYALPDILKLGNFSKSHVYNMMTRGQFPLPVLKLGPRFTRWSALEVDDWFADPVSYISAHSKATT